MNEMLEIWKNQLTVLVKWILMSLVTGGVV